MTSYDDLQRFKEKTQTDHINFKDMSAQPLDADSIKWPIIKQLLSDGAENPLGKTPQAAKVESVPQTMFVAADRGPTRRASENHAASSGTTSSSLKPAAPNASASQKTAAVARLRPEAVNGAGASLLEQLQQSTRVPPHAEPVNSAEPSSQNAAAPEPFASHDASVPSRPQDGLSGATVEKTDTRPAWERPPSSAFQRPAALDVPPQASPSSPLFSTGTYPQQQESAAFQRPLSAQATAQPLFQLTTGESEYAQTTRVQPAAASANISYKQLFSPTKSPVGQRVSKEMPLQTLLEKIASCR